MIDVTLQEILKGKEVTLPDLSAIPYVDGALPPDQVNVATALGVTPAQIAGDTTGLFAAFWSYMSNQNIAPSSAPAATRVSS